MLEKSAKAAFAAFAIDLFGKGSPIGSFKPRLRSEPLFPWFSALPGRDISVPVDA
jgi:hypothetical protein